MLLHQLSFLMKTYDRSFLYMVATLVMKTQRKVPRSIIMISTNQSTVSGLTGPMRGLNSGPGIGLESRDEEEAGREAGGVK